MTSDGRFVIAYQRYYRDAFTGAKDIDILAVQYDNTGHPIGTIPITVASAGAGGGNPSVAVDSSGAFTVDYQNGTSAASGRLDARTYGW
jgi:hypothetical protein